jgi:hypothetical protein
VKHDRLNEGMLEVEVRKSFKDVSLHKKGECTVLQRCHCRGTGFLIFGSTAVLKAALSV